MKLPNIKPNWKRISLSLLLVALAFGSYTAYHVFATPTGQVSSIEGGGFCAGTYTVFNNTIDNLLYAENCATGINSGPSTDLGALLTVTVIPTMAGGQINLRDGYFSVVTPIILCPSCTATSGRAYLGLTLAGSSIGDLPLASYAIGPCAIAVGGNCGTSLVAKTAGMDMIQSTPLVGAVACTTTCSGSMNLVGYTIKDLGLMQNGKANVGMNLSTGSTSAYVTIDHILFYTGSVNGFKVALKLNGYEDTYVSNSFFAGDGVSVANKVDVQWVSPFGNVNFDKDVFGGQINLSLCAQTIMAVESTITSMSMFYNCLNSSQASANQIYLAGNYMANGQGAGRIQLNSTTIWGQLLLQGNYFNTAQPIFLGPGTLKLLGFCGNTIHNVGGSWSSGAPTLTEQKSCGNNALQNSDANPTGSPFTPDGNGVF